MSYYFYCKTCGDSTGGPEIHYTHYDEKELFEIWRVRKAFVEIYNAGLPIPIADGFPNGLLSFINDHSEHDVVINTTNSCRFFCEIPKTKKEIKGLNLIRLQQLISSDGLRSNIEELPSSVPRTVQTICKVDRPGNYTEAEITSVEPFQCRRYSYRREVPAVIYIYEEQK